MYMYMRASSFIPKTMRESAERVGFGHETSELGTSLIPRPYTVHTEAKSNQENVLLIVTF